MANAMCGRASLSAPPEDLRELFGLAEIPPLSPRYNIAPTQPIAIVRESQSRGRILELVRFGLVPRWAKDLRVGARFINARAESVATTPAFRESFRFRRCLVAVDGFFEWAELTPAAGQKKPAKQPFFIHRKDSKPFALAGVWDRWTSESGDVLPSASVLTVASEGALHAIHDRMPFVVSPDDYPAWLAGEGACDPTEILARVRPVAPHDLVAYVVSTRVNSAANDNADCVAPTTC